MKCIVTAGPTYEPVDRVRRLTNFSTGRLGIELASFLKAQGYDVVLLAGEMATWPGARNATEVKAFSTTENLASVLRGMAQEDITAVFHAAAVSDYTVGRTFLRGPQGDLAEVKGGKIATRDGSLLLELVPTPKIIANLREWFPTARLIGWKYEVDGKRDETLAKALRQITECRVDACVANGPGYGLGFGIVRAGMEVEHHRSMDSLFKGLLGLISG